MTTNLLLPNRYKNIGWWILTPSIICGALLTFHEFDSNLLHAKVFALLHGEVFSGNVYFTIIQTDVTNTIVGIFFILGAMMVAFSREKKEDEFIINIRLSSLLWAVFVNYVILLFAFVFVWGIAFLNIMIYNMFTILIIFILRFNYILYIHSKNLSE